MLIENLKYDIIILLYKEVKPQNVAKKMMKKIFEKWAVPILIIMAVLIASIISQIILDCGPVQDYLKQKEVVAETSNYAAVIDSNISLLLWKEDVQVVDLFISETNNIQGRKLTATVLVKGKGIQVYSIDTCIDIWGPYEEQIMEILKQASYSLAEDDNGVKSIIYID